MSTLDNRIVILEQVIALLKEARMADPVHFPGVARKVRSALKSAEGSLRHWHGRQMAEERGDSSTADNHCPECGEYGSECLCGEE